MFKQVWSFFFNSTPLDRAPGVRTVAPGDSDAAECCGGCWGGGL